MPDLTSLESATGGHRQVPGDWMPASQVGPFILEDPALVWLEYHGAAHGFGPDSSPYEFADFIAEKARQFEEKWLAEMAPGAVRVCSGPEEGLDAGKFRESLELMRQGAPVIAQPALWWAPERIYGLPDLLVHTAWLRACFPEAMDEANSRAYAPALGGRGRQGHYVVMDLKFTTKLDERAKTKDLEVYAAQVRIYSYMLGQLQGFMPTRAFLITRDRVADPLPVEITYELGQALDGELAAIRDHFLDIKLNGANYSPWEDEVVASNLDQPDDRWGTAKKIIAREKMPGGDASLLYQVGRRAKDQLSSLGYHNLADLLNREPEEVPFEEVKGLGKKRAGQMRAILEANRSGAAVLPTRAKVPPPKPFEFYVDFEYFTNVNVDFETRWPTLEGQEMVFMIGVGWEDGGRWQFRSLAAERESPDQELAIFQDLIDLLQALMGGEAFEGRGAVLYHWSSAEVWQTRRVAERHQLPPGHPVRTLPWFDLQKVFLDGPVAVPGAWNFGLKSVAKALCDLDPVFGTAWPADLDVGLQAMVMGWRAYEAGDLTETEEVRLLRKYLDADCRALWQVLRWLRAQQ